MLYSPKFPTSLVASDVYQFVKSQELLPLPIFIKIQWERNFYFADRDVIISSKMIG